MAKVTEQEKIIISDALDKAKTAQKTLEKCRADLNDLLSERRKFYNEKPDGWKKSTAGSDYDNFSNEIDGINDNILTESTDVNSYVVDPLENLDMKD